jgi:hypothetical protein
MSKDANLQAVMTSSRAALVFDIGSGNGHGW